MKAEWNPPVVQIIGLLIMTCLACLPVHAQYGGGSGTPDDPYQIWAAEQLNAIGANPADWDKHFKLMADIDLTDYSGEQFNLIGRDLSLPFSGSFDGNAHSIRNFTYRSATTGSVGIFGYVRTESGGTAAVQNLRLVDPNVDAGKAHGVSALVGQLFSGIITGCRVEGGRVSGFAAVGGSGGLHLGDQHGRGADDPRLCCCCLVSSLWGQRRRRHRRWSLGHSRRSTL